MTVLLFLSMTLNVVLFCLAFQLHHRLKELEETLELVRSARDLEAAIHKQTIEKLKSHEEQRNQPATASDIVKNAEKRFKIRKNWQDLELELENQYNTKEKKHLDIAAQIENIQNLGPTPKE